MAEQQQRRYAAAPLETADTYRISDTWTGSVVSVVKGPDAMRRRVDQLNAEETLRRRTA